MNATEKKSLKTLIRALKLVKKYTSSDTESTTCNKPALTFNDDTCSIIGGTHLSSVTSWIKQSISFIHAGESFSFRPKNVDNLISFLVDYVAAKNPYPEFSATNQRLTIKWDDGKKTFAGFKMDSIYDIPTNRAGNIRKSDQSLGINAHDLKESIKIAKQTLGATERHPFFWLFPHVQSLGFKSTDGTDASFLNLEAFSSKRDKFILGNKSWGIDPINFERALKLVKNDSVLMSFHKSDVHLLSKDLEFSFETTLLEAPSFPEYELEEVIAQGLEPAIPTTDAIADDDAPPVIDDSVVSIESARQVLVKNFQDDDIVGDIIDIPSQVFEVERPESDSNVISITAKTAIAGVDLSSLDTLHAEWSNIQEVKKAKSSKTREPKEKVRETMIEPKAEVKPVQRNSICGQILQRLHDEGSIDLMCFEEYGLTCRARMYRKVQHLSVMGYGFTRLGNVYSIVFPEGMAEPLFR